MAERNRRTEEGAELSRHMARFCDQAEPLARLKAPELPPRCNSCAFRAGSHTANGSPQTQMDALKRVMEGVPFLCHETARALERAGKFVRRREGCDLGKVER